MTRKVTKAVFPVAGMGTRFLPATKSIPKEIMTLVDRPLIQYAIDEARAAGMTSRGKAALEDYFDHAPELESTLKRKGKDDILDMLQSTNMESGAIAYVRQYMALGLGHAVWCARRYDVIAAETPCLQQMVEAHAETGGCMVAAMEVPADKASSYGVLDIKEDNGSIVGVKGMVEKPKMNTLKEGAGGEIQLTDAIAREIESERDVYGYRFRGQRYDCGSKAGYLQATVAFGLLRNNLQGTT